MTKRLFDIFFSLLFLLISLVIFFLFFFISSFDCRAVGLFTQKRIGKHGVPFTIFKLRTIHPKTNKISLIGNFIRKYKIDELPQLFNVLLGTMSIVGPRPDIEGYYDKLQGENRKILELKPGITSLASIKYSNEEAILKTKENPLEYNDKVIFPDKVKMNLDYYYQKNLMLDLKIIYLTFLKVFSYIDYNKLNSPK